jgi:hypothetical protein
MERWTVPQGNASDVLQRKWRAIVEAADRRGLTGVWVLKSPCEKVAALVYFRDRTYPSDPQDHDDPQKVATASLAALESQPPLGAVFDGQGWAKVFDRT